jgi:hypothetical protein
MRRVLCVFCRNVRGGFFYATDECSGYQTDKYGIRDLAANRGTDV